MYAEQSLSTVSLSLHELAALLQSRMSGLFIGSNDYAPAWVVNGISLFFVRSHALAAHPLAREDRPPKLMRIPFADHTSIGHGVAHPLPDRLRLLFLGLPPRPPRHHTSESLLVLQISTQTTTTQRTQRTQRILANPAAASRVILYSSGDAQRASPTPDHDVLGGLRWSGGRVICS